jgi:ATP-dependent DNA helicase RecG
MARIRDGEGANLAFTRSTSNTDKFSKAICAFGNDLGTSGEPGYLVIGAEDGNGAPAGLNVSTDLLERLAQLPSNGTILPAPNIGVVKFARDADYDGDLAVVEVRPSAFPPVRFKGQVWVRIGPTMAIATEEQERQLSERRTAYDLTYDARPAIGTSLESLNLALFRNSYLPMAVDPETVAENHREIRVQLASLRLYDLARQAPTHAGILLLGKDPLASIPNAYVQYVRFAGNHPGCDVSNEKAFRGDLATQLAELRSFVRLIVRTWPVAVNALQEVIVSDFPETAVRELLLNAVMHRDYQAPAPVRLFHFDNRIEISSPGVLYGAASPDNFPNQTSYRNPIIAEAMKNLGFVNRFGRGVYRAQAELAKNGSPPAEFLFADTYVVATIRSRP